MISAARQAALSKWAAFPRGLTRLRRLFGSRGPNPTRRGRLGCGGVGCASFQEVEEKVQDHSFVVKILCRGAIRGVAARVVVDIRARSDDSDDFVVG